MANDHLAERDTPQDDLDTADDAQLTAKPRRVGRSLEAARQRFRRGEEAPRIETTEAPAEESDDDVALAARFLRNVARLKGVRIDREQFLRAELRKAGVMEADVETAVRDRPAAAGIGEDVLAEIARATIEFETRKSSALSFAAGLPGGIGIAAAVPADLTQYYIHAFRIMQKLAYLYGWQTFFSDVEHVDDETLGKLAAFLGVMLGVGGAAGTVGAFAKNVAQPALQKQIANKALAKTSWYPVMKQTLKLIGVKVTRDSFAKTVTKAVPVVGGVVGGGMTYASLKTQSHRLAKHLCTLPPARWDTHDPR